MEGVEVEEGGFEVERVASPKTVCKFGKCEAMAEETIFDLGVVEGREEIKDGVDLRNAVGNNVTREGNDSHWSAEEGEALGRSPWNAVIERVSIGRELIPAPNERFGGVESEPHLRAKGLEEDECAVQITASTHESPVVQKPGV